MGPTEVTARIHSCRDRPWGFRVRDDTGQDADPRVGGCRCVLPPRKKGLDLACRASFQKVANPDRETGACVYVVVSYYGLLTPTHCTLTRTNPPPAELPDPA